MSETLTPVVVASVLGATVATLGTIATLYLAGFFSQPSTSEPEPNGHAWKEQGRAVDTRGSQSTDQDPAHARYGICRLLQDVFIRSDALEARRERTAVRTGRPTRT